MMVVIYCYLERENDKCFKFNIINSSYFEITATLQQAPHLKYSKQNSPSAAEN